MGGGCNKHVSVPPVRDLYSLLSQLADLESLTRTRLARQPVWGSAGDSSGVTTLQGAHWVIQQLNSSQRSEKLALLFMFKPQESTNINYAWRTDSLQTLVLWHTVASFSKLWQIVMSSCQHIFIWLFYSSTNMYRDKGESAPLWPALTFLCAPKETQDTKVVSLIVPFYLIENTWIKNIWMKVKKVLTLYDQTSFILILHLKTKLVDLYLALDQNEADHK